MMSACFARCAQPHRDAGQVTGEAILRCLLPRASCNRKSRLAVALLPLSKAKQCRSTDIFPLCASITHVAKHCDSPAHAARRPANATPHLTWPCRISNRDSTPWQTLLKETPAITRICRSTTTMHDINLAVQCRALPLHKKGSMPHPTVENLGHAQIVEYPF